MPETENTTFIKLMQAIDAPAAQHGRLNRAYAGLSPLSFLSPESQSVLGDRLRRLSVNIPRLLVDSVAERLRVTGFSGVDIQPEWLRSQLDQLAPVCHKEALVLGGAYALVWAGADGRPQVTIESAQQVASTTDPATRRITAAAKRWTTDSTTEATLFLPDRIERYRAGTTGATSAGFKLIDTLDNPLGAVPVVRFTNTSRLLDIEGRSEMEDVLDLTDALTKLLTDLMVASETAARPRRWATGIELVDEDDEGNAISPFDETTKMLIAEQAEAKFGQLPGADLAGYENAIGVVMRQISAVSGLPEHMLGIGGDNPTSADSIRASEAALTSRAEAKQQSFGQSWESVAQLIVGVRDGADPTTVEARVEWADASTRSESQVADSVTKLFTAGLLPADYALRRLGYSETEIADIRTARRTEQLDKAAVDGLGAA
ncbi:phage portal protein [Tsukamurella tyrosinosolvens]|uniref:phage portal protein n=1 Tax=Tsukamurella tyrosinosolvens TaxID=57704 RepID=UPI003F49CD34